MIRRHLRRIITAAAALALLGAVLAVTLPAHADITTLEDGFEGNAHKTWTSVEVRGKSLVFLHNTVERRSGINAAWLFGGPKASEAARIYRQVVLNAPVGSQLCSASLYMRATNTRTPPTVTVLLRPKAVSEPSWWTNVFTVTNGNYEYFSLGSIPYAKQFVMDISSVGEVMIDDIFFKCNEPPR
jgi:hypothetical protein